MREIHGCILVLIGLIVLYFLIGLVPTLWVAAALAVSIGFNKLLALLISEEPFRQRKLDRIVHTSQTPTGAVHRYLRRGWSVPIFFTLTSLTIILSIGAVAFLFLQYRWVAASGFVILVLAYTTLQGSRSAKGDRGNLQGSSNPLHIARLSIKRNQLIRQGRYDEALALTTESYAWIRQSLGESHTAFAICAGDLAQLHHARGDYTRAEPLYQQALAIWRRIRRSLSPEIAQGLNNLGLLYYAKGDYSQAESLYREALAIWRKTRRSTHPEIAYCLNNLAELYRTTGDYAQAEPLYQEALAIWRATLGEDRLPVATVLNSLGMLYQSKGNYVQAESLYQQALAIWCAALGEEHPNMAQCLTNLAALYDEKGDYVQAE